MTATVRPPAVAGRFYPADPATLAGQVNTFMDATDAGMDELGIEADSLRAVVAPHAGYMYSGPIAGSAYSMVEQADDRIRLVVLAGPSHFVPVSGVATSTADFWRTPLGDVPIARAAVQELQDLHRYVRADDEAHASEHSLEVQLPFLQQALRDEWELLPLAVGHLSSPEMAAVLTPYLSREDTLVVISTDLSHYLTYDQARERDLATCAHVLSYSVESIHDDDACGAYPLRGLMAACQELDLLIDLVALASSGDTAGSRDRVVGYGSFAVTDLQ